MPSESHEEPSYRIVCERCEMRTGRMCLSTAMRACVSHEDSTGHDTEIECDE